MCSINSVLLYVVTLLSLDSRCCMAAETEAGVHIEVIADMGDVTFRVHVKARSLVF